MKIGILGSGIVGVTLANGFVKHGYEVMIGTNTSSKHEDLRAKTGGNAAVGTFAETANFGETLVLAVKGLAAEAALLSAQFPNLKGKTVIDATNPITQAKPVNGVIEYFTSFDDSLMERLQRLVPEANFVKAFNSVGAALMVDPDLHGLKPSMFIAGNSEAARAGVTKILLEFGWEVEDLGKAEAARAIEPLCMLWCIPGFLQNDWMHAFKMLRK